MPESEESSSPPPLIIGRYAIFGEVARGGMAAVHVGRLSAPGGFTRTVAVKRLHPAFASDPEFVAMFLDEARLAARINHPNVVSTMDVVATKGELFMVMEYVHGESFSNLLRASRERGEPVPVEIAVQIVVNVLFGIHAAHEATSSDGEPLAIVHRDMSPQNVLVGVDGLARVIDFGVAKAAARMRETTDGNVKGKVSYMSPEQLSAKEVDRRTDIWAVSVMLWEALAGQRLFDYQELGQIVGKVLCGQLDPPSKVAAMPSSISPALDRVVMKGLAVKHENRWATAHEMALALEATVPPIAQRVVAKWVEATADERLRYRADIISRTEHSVLPSLPMGTLPPPAIEAIEKAATTLSGMHSAVVVSSSPPSSSAKSLNPHPGPSSSPREEPTIAESSGSLPHEIPSTRDFSQPPSKRTMRLLAAGSFLLGVLGLLMIVKTIMTVRSPNSTTTTSSPSTSSSSVASIVGEPSPSSSPSSLPPSGEPSRPPPPLQTSTPFVLPAPTNKTKTPAAHPTAAATTTPAPTPTPSPTPSSTPAPPPTPTPPTPTVEKPKMNVASARVDLGAPSNASGTSATNVNRVITPLGGRITECYRAALSKTNAAVEGGGNLHIETDEDGVIVKASVSGAVTAPAGCIAGVVTGKKIPNVDTGRARADVPLVFHAQ